eukprot:Nitzschia sp. Nitz4//scaffold132_size63325//38852//39484//NITZ4_006293-RA/size63325-exonerate_est2genome-gene-0.36-mRNA-1//-1//CDS//3329535323//2541//frame0
MMKDLLETPRLSHHLRSCLRQTEEGCSSASTLSKRRVSFSQAETSQAIFEYEPVGQFRNHCWYSADEFRDMATDVDTMTKQRKQHVAGVRRFFVFTILNLQDDQRDDEGSADPNLLAEMAVSCTRFSSRDAQTRAAILAKEVHRYRCQEVLAILDDVLDLINASDDDDDNNMLRPPKRLLSP